MYKVGDYVLLELGYEVFIDGRLYRDLEGEYCLVRVKTADVNKKPRHVKVEGYREYREIESKNFLGESMSILRGLPDRITLIQSVELEELLTDDYKYFRDYANSRLC